mmetsp:Transcript_35646/g.73234  ORF Transcript_35646/g.73234 Transcript_35646/m.73234 type:complete len:117 (-) Transcript_35646:14-364(-)
MLGCCEKVVVTGLASSRANSLCLRSTPLFSAVEGDVDLQLKMQAGLLGQSASSAAKVGAVRVRPWFSECGDQLRADPHAAESYFLLEVNRCAPCQVNAREISCQFCRHAMENQSSA